MVSRLLRRDFRSHPLDVGFGRLKRHVRSKTCVRDVGGTGLLARIERHPDVRPESHRRDSGDGQVEPSASRP